MVGDAFEGFRGSSLARISRVRSSTSSEVDPRRASLISDRVRDLLEDLPDHLLLLPHDFGPLFSPLRVAYPGTSAIYAPVAGIGW